MNVGMPRKPNAGTDRRRKFRSGAKVLASTLATGAQNLAATDRFLTREKSVPAGTHEIAGLKSPLHIVLD